MLPAEIESDPIILKQIKMQLQKDFALQALHLSSEVLQATDLTSLATKLGLFLESQCFLQSPKLKGVLYQMDVSDKQIVSKLNNLTPQNVYFALAYILLENCYKKIRFRQLYKNGKL